RLTKLTPSFTGQAPTTFVSHPQNAGVSKGECMIRTTSVLQSGVALVAIIAAASSASAQSTLPPPDVQNAPAAPSVSPQATGGEIVITGSRIRRNPLDLDAPRVFIDQQDIQKTGLNS